MLHCLEAHLMKEDFVSSFLMVSNITHLAIELNVLVFIVVKSQSLIAQNVILDFTLIVFKVIMKM